MGSDGVCEGCGKAISQERLEAMPDARRCFACAVKLDGLEETSPEEATAEHATDEATELTIPAFAARDADEAQEDAHTVQTDVSKLRGGSSQDD